MAEIKDLLDEVIETELHNLEAPLSGEDKSEAIKNLAVLHKLRIEEVKAETDAEDKQRRFNDQNLDRYLKLGVAAAELILPLMFYGCWMRRGLRFEETGTFTSTTFKNLLSRFRPTRKG